MIQSATYGDWLSVWLCNQIGLTASPNFVSIGSVINGEIKGAVGFDGYNGASIMIHSAGSPHWLTKDLLHAAFDYPFNVCGVNILIGLVPSGNTEAIRFNKHLGFKIDTTLDGGHPDGALLIMTMRKEDCRFLKIRSHHGQEEFTTTTA